MAVSLTPNAIAHIRRQLERRGGGVGLKLGVRKSGCSGFAYALDYADEIRPEDTVFESEGIKVVVPADALSFVNGTVVDYVSEGLNQMFRFSNPNIKDACGCGESFTV